MWTLCTDVVTVEILWNFPPKLELESPYDPAISLLCIFQKESKFTDGQYIHLFPYLLLHHAQ